MVTEYKVRISRLCVFPNMCLVSLDYSRLGRYCIDNLSRAEEEGGGVACMLY